MTYAAVGFGEAVPPRNPLSAPRAGAGRLLGVAAPAAGKRIFGATQSLQTSRLRGDRVSSATSNVVNVELEHSYPSMVQ
jgi:hypothetical protein